MNNYKRLSFLYIVLMSVIGVSAQTAQTITFPDIPVKGYGDTSFSLNATASSGLGVTYYSSNTSVASISGSTVTINATGWAFILAYQAGNSTYAAATPVAQLLVVTPKATLTVTADNKSINAGASTPSLTYTVTGYKKSETSSVLTGTPAITSPGNNLSAGTYPIVINKGTLSATNYEFMMVDGSLTVNSQTSVSLTKDNISVLVVPNPASEWVKIENADDQDIALYNQTGILLYRTKVENGIAGFSVSAFPAGIYFVVAKKNGQQITRKLLIFH